MAGTITDVEKVGSYSFKYTWSGTSPYDSWVDGYAYFTGTTQTSAIIELGTSGGSETEPPALELQDSTDTNTAENILYPPYLTLQWRGSTDNLCYRVQESVSAVWTTRANVSEIGLAYYKWATDLLADVTTHSWRVVAVDDRGYESTAVNLSAFMVRNPAPPVINMSYSSGTGLLSVTT